MFPNLFHFTNTKSFTPPHSIAILFHILFIFIFFNSNLLEHSTEGLAWRPGLINCESSEIGLENGAWRLALGAWQAEVEDRHIEILHAFSLYAHRNFKV